MSQTTPDVGRRGFLRGAGALGAVGAAATLAGCTSNATSDAAATPAPVAAGSGGASVQAGVAVTIGFSAPAADHGWIAAITNFARAQADTFSDVTLQATEGTNDVNLQISQVQTLIDAGVDAIVILPFDGNALTEIGRTALAAGIPVVNLDRAFSGDDSYRTFIAGDNYGMGISAGKYIGQRLTDEGVSEPVIGEIAGIDALELTQQRSQGFSDALATFGFEVGPRQAAEFTVESGDEVTRALLQGTPTFDAIWNHDDDQGIGVLAAIDDLGRDEFFLVGGAGSLNAMEAIKAGNSVLEATVTYPPSMSADAINLARAIAQGGGLAGLVNPSVPKTIILASDIVTADNVDSFLAIGFPS